MTFDREEEEEETAATWAQRHTKMSRCSREGGDYVQYSCVLYLYMCVKALVCVGVRKTYTLKVLPKD